MSAPPTLPADFFEQSQSSAQPHTLPADFFDKPSKPLSGAQLGIAGAQGLLGEFASGVGDVAKGLWDMVTKPSQEITEHVQKGEYGQALKKVVEQTIPGYTLVVKPQLEQFGQAYDYARAGRPAEAVGHAVAGLTPVVGPMAAGLTETAAGEPEMPPGQQVGPARIPQPVRAAGQAATMAVLPEITESIPGAAKAVARGAGDVALKIPPRVAERVGKVAGATAGGAIGHATAIPGAGVAGVLLGRELGEGLGPAWERLQGTIRAGREIPQGPPQPPMQFEQFGPGRPPQGPPEPPMEFIPQEEFEPPPQTAAEPPTPEQQAQTARDAHEADFKDKVTESLSGGAVKNYANLEDPRAVSVVDRLTREEMARYDRQAQAAAPPPETPPAGPETTPGPPAAPPATPAPSVAPTEAPPAIPATAPPIPPGTTIEDLLRQDLAQKRAARPPEPAPAERLAGVAQDVFSRQPAPPQPSVVPANPSLAELQDAMRALIERRRAAQAPGEVAAPPGMPAAGPQEPVSAPTGPPVAPTPQETVATLSDALNRMLAEEPAPAARDFPAEARGRRADLAGKFADYLPSKGVTAADVAAMNNREQLLPHARDAGLDIPKSKDAFAKLRDAIAGEMQSREAAAPAGAPPPLEPSLFNPSAIQKLIDAQERGLKRPGGMPTFEDIQDAMRRLTGEKAPAAAPEQPRAAINQSVLSPSGRVSKRAEAAAKERIRQELFSPQGLEQPTQAAVQPSDIQALRAQAQQLRDLAARGMKPKAYAAKAAELEAQAARLEAEPDFSHSSQDSDYWGRIIADRSTDPRNITREEWGNLKSVYNHLIAEDEDPWIDAKAVAERIARERGNIPKSGPGEATRSAKVAGSKYDRVFAASHER